MHLVSDAIHTMRFLIVLSLAACAMADGTGHHHGDHGSHDDGSSAYNAPASAYNAPTAPSYDAPAYNAPTQDSYGAPQEAPVYAAPQEGYGAPQEGYGPPSTDYGAPTGYEAPATGYGPPAEDSADLFDLSALMQFVPLFLAVFAAIIVSQLFAPLLGILFGAKFNLFSTAFGPILNFKTGLLNTALLPFNLALCDISGAAPVVSTGRTLGEEFTLNTNTDNIDLVANMLYKAIESKAANH